MSLVGVPYCFVLSLLGQLWSTRHPDVVLNSNAFQIRGLTLVKSFLSKLSIEFLRASTFLPSIHPVPCIDNRHPIHPTPTPKP